MDQAERENQLRRLLMGFAQTMVTDYLPADALDELMKAVPNLLDVDGAGIMLEDDDGELRFVSASNERLRLIEEFQVETGEGPCVRSYETGEPVVADDLADQDTPFPNFAKVALSNGMRAVHSFPMTIEGARVGALNLYRDEPGSLPDNGNEMGHIFADIATTYLFSARRHDALTRQIEGMRAALDHNGIIDQAKGVLMHDFGMEDRTAFAALRRRARTDRLRILAVAQAIMDREIDPADLATSDR